MPTMAKLFSAALLAALGYFIADMIGNNLPEEQRQNYLRGVTTVLGAMVGWKFLGPRVRGEWNHALGLGASAGLMLTVVALFWFAGYEMLRKATRMAYGGNVMEALEDMFQQAIELAVHLTSPEVLIASVVGSFLVGVSVTAVARRWP